MATTNEIQMTSIRLKASALARIKADPTLSMLTQADAIDVLLEGWQTLDKASRWASVEAVQSTRSDSSASSCDDTAEAPSQSA